MKRRTFLASLAGGLVIGRTSWRGQIAAAQEASPVAAASAAAGATPVATMPPAPAGTEYFATGLNNPRGLRFGADGALYVAEAGTGGDQYCAKGPEGDEICYGATGSVARVAPDGSLERTITGLASSGAKGTGMNATGPHGIAFVNGDLYLVTGLGADPAARKNLGPIGSELGMLFKYANGERSTVADVSASEASANPDGGQIDSNPYAIEALADGSFAVSDAGANAVFHVTADGTISTLAVFPDRQATLPDGSKAPMQAVPEALAIGPDGRLYVGQLTGFPFPVGGANVFVLPAAGGEPQVFADGFTNIIGIAFAPDQSLYVLEMVKGGLANVNPQDPTTMEGQLTRVAPDGSKRIVAGAGTTMPTAVAIGPDKMIYLANLGIMAGAASIVRMPLPA
ncbi:MAG TPA: ScyD/ScyE family protein [Thermomicrobiales bacterium]|nr:ScyD/ScyE family protein [Thermomicrobiales bacterium]